MAFVVTLGSFSFGATDGDGDRFVLQDIVGWTGIPVEIGVVEKPLSTGAVIAYSRYKARPLILKGFGIASTRAQVWRMRAKLEAAAALAAVDVTLTVPEPAGNKTLSVRLADTMRVRLVGMRAVEFEIPLLAANPVKA